MSDSLDRAIVALRTHHDRLAEVIAGLTPEQLKAPSAASEWSLAQVLSHLGSGAEIFLPRYTAGIVGEAASGGRQQGDLGPVGHRRPAGAGDRLPRARREAAAAPGGPLRGAALHGEDRPRVHARAGAAGAGGRHAAQRGRAALVGRPGRPRLRGHGRRRGGRPRARAVRRLVVLPAGLHRQARPAHRAGGRRPRRLHADAGRGRQPRPGHRWTGRPPPCTDRTRRPSG